MKLLGWLVPVLDELYPKKIGHLELQTRSVFCWPTTLSHCFRGRNLTLIPENASKEALVRSERSYSTIGRCLQYSGGSRGGIPTPLSQGLDAPPPQYLFTPTWKAIRYSMNDNGAELEQFISVSVGLTQSSLLLIYFRYGRDTRSQVWQKTIRYVTLHSRDRRGAASLRYRNHRSCVWTETLTGTLLVSAL